MSTKHLQYLDAIVILTLVGGKQMCV